MEKSEATSKSFLKRCFSVALLRGILIALSLVFLVCLGLFVVVFFNQHKLIYFPRNYDTYGTFKNKAESVVYEVDGNKMAAYLFPKPLPGQKPEIVWWIFNGNGSVALDWVSLLETSDNHLPETHTYVLVDYPGYGDSEGKPSPQAIYNSVAQLHSLLADRWTISEAELSSRSRALGFSLGAAVALHTAAEYEMKQVVAVAPFTSMKEMARKNYGFLSVVLTHNYNNRASVKKLNSQKNGPAEIIIFHGNQDRAISMEMGRELSKMSDQGNIHFQVVPGHGHNDILYPIKNDLLHILTVP